MCSNYNNVKPTNPKTLWAHLICLGNVTVKISAYLWQCKYRSS